MDIGRRYDWAKFSFGINHYCLQFFFDDVARWRGREKDKMGNVDIVSISVQKVEGQSKGGQMEHMDRSRKLLDTLC